MFIQHDDAELFVVSFGTGSRTLVGIGGWTGSWEVWADVFGLLSPRWRTVGIDHRGTGATLAGTEGVSFAQMADDLLAVLDQLGIEQCVLAAESSGTAVALTAAQQQPERFEGLVLVGGLYYRPDSAEPDRFLMGLERGYETAVNQFITTCLPETNSPAIHQWANKILMRASQDAAIALYKANFGLDLRPILRHITTPTLIIHGDADRIVPVAAAHWLATQLPNNQFTILPGAGHAPMMTMPHEVAAAINNTFITFKAS
ncbi:MAG: alpha/beta hydrolase [Anaerolineales bacterium]|nr:alpha/beta hydrolase [Anaerolineales bacterium]